MVPVCVTERIEKQLSLTPSDSKKFRKIVLDANNLTLPFNQQVDKILALANFMFEKRKKDIGACLKELIDTKRDAAFVSSLVGKIQYKAELAPEFLDEPRLKDKDLARCVFARAMQEAVTFDKYIFLNTLLNHEIRRRVCSNPLDQKVKQAFLDVLKICLAEPKYRCLAILKVEAESELRALFSEEPVSRELLSSVPQCRNQLIGLLQFLQQKATFRTERGTSFKYVLDQTAREVSSFERVLQEEEKEQKEESRSSHRKMSASSYVDPQDYNKAALELVSVPITNLVLPPETSSSDSPSKALDFDPSPGEELEPLLLQNPEKLENLALGSISREASLDPDHIAVKSYNRLFSIESETGI